MSFHFAGKRGNYKMGKDTREERVEERKRESGRVKTQMT
jgi:hypothetical protein